ncbi:DNA photolyase [Aureococcus anophagefferens]|nr:DNA photolyase [Aureococcus anophagefferens]
MSALAATAKPTTIVWLRDELRVHDNALLAEAAARGGPVLPVYVLDDRVFDAAATSESGGSRKCGAKRVHAEAPTTWRRRARGSGLVVERAARRTCSRASAPPSAATRPCSAPTRPAPRAQGRGGRRKGRALAKVWEGTLYHPEDLRGVAFHDLFTAWRTKVEKAGTRVRGDVFKAATLPAPPALTLARGAAPHARRPRLRRGRRGLRRPRRLLRARGRRDRGARAPAQHFEEHLVDYTPEANWGNWHAAAGLSGGRVNRFNILKQSKDYDPKGDYVKL